jgi:hypothetical protein
MSRMRALDVESFSILCVKMVYEDCGDADARCRDEA